MKKFNLILLLIFGLIFSGCKQLNQEEKTNNLDAGLTNIRIGWQIPWATQGQLTQILKKTDLLKDNSLEGEFEGFSYGGPLNEAALAEEVDLIFTADQPAAMLLAKNPEWTIIGRLMYNRVVLYVPPKSPINSVAELKGKTVAMPFGAAAQRMALQAEEEAGLDPQKDVNNINLGIYEQSDLVKDPEAEQWGSIDALAGFDPTPAIFEEKGLVRNLNVGKVVSLIVISNEYIEKNPEAPVKFLRAFFNAYDYYRNNVEQANMWFTEEAKLDITPKALEIAASIEPNLEAESKEDIRIGFIEDDYKVMQEAADFLYEQDLVKTRVNMKDHIDLSYLNKALGN